MAARKTPKKRAIQVNLRIREPLRASLYQAAKKRGTSLNEEMIQRLERSFEADQCTRDLADAREALSRAAVVVFNSAHSAALLNIGWAILMLEIGVSEARRRGIEESAEYLMTYIERHIHQLKGEEKRLTAEMDKPSEDYLSAIRLHIDQLRKEEQRLAIEMEAQAANGCRD